tara:strand:+ start:360 stop:1121 length:762 start_codon:yes stop_codon:yes gene_type:complete
MNYFFGFKNSNFYSEIQIPLFQNRKPKTEEILLYKVFINNNSWEVTQLEQKIVQKNFYIVNSDEIENGNFFFLSTKKDLENFDNNMLINLNNFTDTSPSFRANFKIILKNGGFSSYQSEYPFRMVSKKGSILSSVCSLANTDADKNYILIKNIYKYPTNEKFTAYLVDIKNKKIEEKVDIKTNYTNCFELSKKLIKPEIFLVTDHYLGLPMYLSTKNNHVSFEHTHPPHEYILSKNRFELITKLKNEILEIIN